MVIMKIDVALRIFVLVCLVLLLGIGCASGATLVVNQTSPACASSIDYFTSIQAAVDGANDWDDIVVCPGTYVENINVDKSLTIRSENGADSTIVRAEDPYDHIVEVTADSVNISGFTVQGATGWWKSGIYLYCADYCTISKNNCTTNSHGIRLYKSDSSSISNNNCSDNFDTGIVLIESNNAIINGNTANANKEGGGISLSRSNNSYILNNDASDNLDSGIELSDSNNNIIRRTTANSNEENPGIMLKSSNRNILLNNILSYNNDVGVSLSASNDNNVTSNIIHSNSKAGLYLELESQKNNISYNIINSNRGYGILLLYSENNNIVNNIINSNQRCGLEFQGSRKNNALSNFIDSNGEEGIILFNSSSITISGNTISSNFREGIAIEEDSYFNKLYHNNIIDDKIYDKSLNSWWYNQSQKEGNYWSDYDGVDDGSGTGEHAIAGDGIGDTNIPYPEEGYDLYPLMSRDGWLTASICPHYLDFRRVYQKTLVNQTFNITNYGNSILNVTSIKSDPAINITGITLPAEIPKGESQSFNITLNTENLEGFVLKNIEIIANDNENPHKNISIFGFVDVHSPKVEIMGINFLPRIIKGQINLFNVTLINTGDFREKNVSIEFKEGDNSLGNTTITNIESKENKSAIFRWDTTDVEAKMYDIVIEVKLKDNQLTLASRQVSVMVDIPSAPQTLII